MRKSFITFLASIPIVEKARKEKRAESRAKKLGHLRLASLAQCFSGSQIIFESRFTDQCKKKIIYILITGNLGKVWQNLKTLWEKHSAAHFESSRTEVKREWRKVIEWKSMSYLRKRHFPSEKKIIEKYQEGAQSFSATGLIYCTNWRSCRAFIFKREERKECSQISSLAHACSSSTRSLLFLE